MGRTTTRRLLAAIELRMTADVTTIYVSLCCTNCLLALGPSDKTGMGWPIRDGVEGGAFEIGTVVDWGWREAAFSRLPAERRSVVARVLRGERDNTAYL